MNGCVMANKSALSTQTGMVLIVGLIMVLLMSIIGVAAIRGSNMQELMAGNMRDRNLAFQAAEAGLRMAEARVQTSGASLVFDNTGGLLTNQNLTTAAKGPVSHWDSTLWDSTALTLTKTDIDLQLSKLPQYVIERLEVSAAGSAATGGAVEYGATEDEVTSQTLYRITSRGFGGSGESSVILQSTFRANN